MSGAGAPMVIQPAKRVEGRLEVPGDKAISHRAVLVGAIAEGAVGIENLSPAEDVARSLVAAGALGATIGDGQIVGPGWDDLAEPAAPLDAGNSATTARMLLGLLAGSRVTATIDGDGSLRRRPMLRVVEPLRAMGARIEGADEGDHAPLVVRGSFLSGAAHELGVASAQVKTALLLAGLRAQGSTSVLEPAPSRDHTERLLAHLGVPIRRAADGRLSVAPAPVGGGEIAVPGDFSSAAFLFAAAALLPDSEVTVDNVGLNPTRTGFLQILRRYGASVDVVESPEVSQEPRGTVTVRSGERRAVSVGREEVPAMIDELPLVAILGAFAEGTSEVRGAEELRVKESDRIAGLATPLRAMGVGVEQMSDGFVVRGGRRPAGTRVSSAGDHRLAMALAIAALGAQGETTIDGWDAVAVSYPGFGPDLERLVVR